MRGKMKINAEKSKKIFDIFLSLTSKDILKQWIE